MTSASPWVRAAAVVAVGLLPLLAGCPGDISSGDSVPVLTVKVIEGDQSRCSKPENLDAVVERVVELVNIERTSRGLQPLTLNSALCEIADDYCCEMIEKGFFSHINPYNGDGPGQRASRGGYDFWLVGETLAGGQASAEQVVREWMQSTDGHREILLDHRWRDVGVSVRIGGEHGVYWVQEFASPLQD